MTCHVYTRLNLYFFSLNIPKIETLILLKMPTDKYTVEFDNTIGRLYYENDSATITVLRGSQEFTSLEDFIGPDDYNDRKVIFKKNGRFMFRYKDVKSIVSTMRGTYKLKKIVDLLINNYEAPAAYQYEDSDDEDDYNDDSESDSINCNSKKEISDFIDNNDAGDIIDLISKKAAMHDRFDRAILIKSLSRAILDINEYSF